ncbi:phosphotransferase [Kutzneria kofuensis]|uniref:Aminoglycoside phosphotransferase domain-containing protein n=1 Tax=Kutzneria kofuensis TaxID=103725 RepID=A0A7W9NLD6_9PSEU|nr:phosphotransferase [Kutzneria kofuensis]MBB5896346.1 hypothetical protein [Kutzneria kofuensis]
MSTPASRSERQVDEQAVRLLSAAFDGTGAAVSFRSWTPVGARKIRKRRFTMLVADGTPALVCKTALDIDDAKVGAEATKLDTLDLPASLTRARVLSRHEGGFVMTYVPALDLPDALAGRSQESFATLLGRAVELVAALHRHSRVDGDVTRRRAVAGQYVAEELLHRPELRAAVDVAVLAATHGDLAPWNVRHDPETDRLSLIDWEDYRHCGIAGIDIVNLLTTLGLVVFPEYRTRGLDWLYDQIFGGSHWYSRLVHDLIVRYATATGQAPGAVLDLLPFHCAWMTTRITAEGRDPSQLYYATFLRRYVSQPPGWFDASAA